MGKKNNAYEFGEFAEEIIAQEYIKKGYTVLERRFRMGKTEIDIIAQKENVIILIEVKARSGKDEDALSAVTTDKRRRMIRTADAYLRRLEGQFEYRFDIATMTGNQEKYEIEIFKDAFVAADLF